MKMETRSTLLTLPTASPPNSCVSNCKWKGPFVLITSSAGDDSHPLSIGSPHAPPGRHGPPTAMPTAPRSWGPCTTSSLQGREVGRPVPRPAGRARRQVARVHSRSQGGVEPKVGAFERREGYGGGHRGVFSRSAFRGCAPAAGRRGAPGCESWSSYGRICLSYPPAPGPQSPPQSRSPGSTSGTENRPRGSGRRGQSGLPLVGGGVPGPRQPRAPHRLVPEGAVLVDAAHDAHRRCARRPGAPGQRTGSRTGRGEARGARAGERFPGADPGRARSGPGLGPAGPGGT